MTKSTTETEIDDSAWEAAVSAWADGEADMRAEELDSPYGRQIWDTYHLIGDVMRSQDLAIKPSERFYARISAALDAEAPQPPIAAPSGASRLVLPALAIAAAIAAVVFVARPYLGSAGLPADQEPVLAQSAEPEQPDPGLADYMAAHQGVLGAGGLRQASFDSAGAP